MSDRNAYKKSQIRKAVSLSKKGFTRREIEKLTGVNANSLSYYVNRGKARKAVAKKPVARIPAEVRRRIDRVARATAELVRAMQA